MFDFCMGHTMDTTALAFLEPYPLLSSCDSSGNVAIWTVPPYHPSVLQCVCWSVRSLAASICEVNLILVGTSLWPTRCFAQVLLPLYGSLRQRACSSLTMKAPYISSTCISCSHPDHSIRCRSVHQQMPVNCACASTALLQECQPSTPKTARGPQTCPSGCLVLHLCTLQIILRKLRRLSLHAHGAPILRRFRA
jgi:hypothetical protein